MTYTHTFRSERVIFSCTVQNEADDVGAERDYVPKDYMSYARSVVKQSVRDVSCNGVCDS